MDVLKPILWILLYVFTIAIVPSFVVLMAGFFAGLGFFLRDLEYDISKALKRRTEVIEE